MCYIEGSFLSMVNSYQFTQQYRFHGDMNNAAKPRDLQIFHKYYRLDGGFPEASKRIGSSYRVRPM